MKELLRGGYNGTNNWGTGRKKYTVKEGYTWLKGQFATLQWHHWVWAPFDIPKHSVIGWMIAMGKVRTRERLAAAGLCHETQCLLCVIGMDACSHLFFRCHLSRIICVGVMEWLRIKSKVEEYLYTDWKRWGRKYKSKKCQKSLLLCTCCCCVPCMAE